jgi:hypothetical protein
MNTSQKYKCLKFNNVKKSCNQLRGNTSLCPMITYRLYDSRYYLESPVCVEGVVKIEWTKEIIHKGILNGYFTKI